MNDRIDEGSTPGYYLRMRDVAQSGALLPGHPIVVHDAQRASPSPTPVSLLGKKRLPWAQGRLSAH